MSVERHDWSTLSPPVYSEPRSVEVAVRLEWWSGITYCITCVGADGELLSFERSRCPARAAKRTADVLEHLRKLTRLYPNGVPFNRSRAQ